MKNENINSQNDTLHTTPWTLVFKDKAEERAYREDYFNKSLIPLRVALIIVSTIYVLFGLLDVYTSRQFLKEFIPVRFLIVAPCILITYALSFFPHVFKKHWQTLLSACYVVAGTGISYMLLRNPDNIYYYGGLMLIFIGGYFFIKLHFRNAVLAGFLVLLLYNIAPFFSRELHHANILIITNAFFISANIIAAAALHTSEKTARREFLQRQLLAKQKHEIRLNNETLETQVAKRTTLLRERNQILHNEIAHRKEIEEHLRVAIRKAEESDRLKSAFLANMSHEIRTPMNAIVGFLDLISDPGINREQQAHFLNIIAQSGNRLLQTINDIVEISKIESEELLAQLSPVNLEQTFLHLQKLHATEAAEKNLQLEIEGDYHKLDVRTDGTKLESILSNLIKNAIKFTDQGKVSFGVRKKGDKLCFWVKDSGIGIPADKQEIIFTRFTQADLDLSRGYEGSGLGLSICKAYVNLLGGEIRVESEPHKGSTFYFTIDHIPVIPDNQPLENRVTTPAESPAPRKKVALVAEDDETSYSLLENILSGEAMEVIWAKNGEEAVQLMADNPDIAIIFMDIKMPLMDGIEATRTIRKSNPNVPIIAQTAFALSGDCDKALQAGCNNYLPKPIRRNDMVEILKQFV